MFQLLSELVELNSSGLNENLGQLREMFGRMTDVFKQQFSAGQQGYGRNKYINYYTHPIGHKINRYDSNIRPNSSITDVGIVTNWGQVKKAIKKNNGCNAIAFSINNKTCMIIVGGDYDILQAKGFCGVAWDFTGINGIDEEKLEGVLSHLSTETETTRYGKDPEHVFSHPLQSKRSVEKSNSNDEVIVKHFEGIGQKANLLPKIFDGGEYYSDVKNKNVNHDGLFAILGNRVHMKIIGGDADAIETRNKRWKNPPIDPQEMKLFKDDIKTRLAKYKNTKVQTVEDLAAFVKTVFEGEAKKIKFNGKTYSAVPGAEYLGSNDGYRHQKKHQSYYNATMQKLFSGKEVSMTFNADRAAGEYDTIYLWVKFEKGQLIPTKATYPGPDGKTVTETI